MNKDKYDQIGDYRLDCDTSFWCFNGEDVPKKMYNYLKSIYDGPVKYDDGNEITISDFEEWWELYNESLQGL